MEAAQGGQTHEAVADLHKALIPGGSSARLRSSSEPLLGGTSGLAGHLKTPGGFRRDFLHAQAEAQGLPMHARPQAWRMSLLETLRGLPDARVCNYEAILGILLDDDGGELPLPPGHSGIPQTVLALCKSFVGSGITFLPGAFRQGGWLFSSLSLLGIAGCNAVCISLLLGCSARTRRSGFGEIAELAAGRGARLAVHVSLVISQFGTNVAYLIFVGQMAASLGVRAYVDEAQVLACVVVLIVPLCWIRSIHKLEATILVADVLIVFGLVIVLWFAALDITGEQGIAPGLQAFSPSTCGVFMGTAIFTFEGIPFILPIRSSMREPDRFWQLFMRVFFCIALFFVSFGLVGYADFGASVETVVLVNLPRGSTIASSVRAAYMVALILGSPLCFLPAARITELWAFGVVKEKGSRKWQKNALRTAEMCFLGAVALYGGNVFEKFLAFVGGLCCAPIAFIYPAYFHLRLCAETPSAKALDCFFVALGFVAMVFVVAQAAIS